MTDKFLFMLGLAKKAGSIIIGTELVTKNLAGGKIKQVIYTNNSSANTEKKITDKCRFYNVECLKINYSSDIIGHTIGKCGSVCVIGITNESFSTQLKSLILNN